MFRYQPPKSSIWGHLLRRMPAERARRLFHQFLDVAAAEYTFRSASLIIHDPLGLIAQRYQSLIEKPFVNGYVYGLTFGESERCIDERISDEARAAGAAHFVLSQNFEVTKWRVNGSETPTESSLGIKYGPLPCLTTSLQFETIEQFHSVQRVLADLRLCKLSEKHLKPIKVRKAK